MRLRCFEPMFLLSQLRQLPAAKRSPRRAKKEQNDRPQFAQRPQVHRLTRWIAYVKVRRFVPGAQWLRIHELSPYVC